MIIIYYDKFESYKELLIISNLHCLLVVIISNKIKIKK